MAELRKVLLNEGSSGELKPLDLPRKETHGTYCMSSLKANRSLQQLTELDEESEFGKKILTLEI